MITKIGFTVSGGSEVEIHQEVEGVYIRQDNDAIQLDPEDLTVVIDILTKFKDEFLHENNSTESQ